MDNSSILKHHEVFFEPPLTNGLERFYLRKCKKCLVLLEIDDMLKHFAWHKHFIKDSQHILLLELPVRVFNALYRQQILTIEDLIEDYASTHYANWLDYFLDMRNIGFNSAEQAVDSLVKYGFNIPNWS